MICGNLYLDLYFVKPNCGDRSPPCAYVRLSPLLLKLRDIDPRTLILLTPDCLAFSELNAQIDMLQEELENVRKRARRRFRKADREFREARAVARQKRVAEL